MFVCCCSDNCGGSPWGHLITPLFHTDFINNVCAALAAGGQVEYDIAGCGGLGFGAGGWYVATA